MVKGERIPISGHKPGYLPNFLNDGVSVIIQAKSVPYAMNICTRATVKKRSLVIFVG